MSGRSRIVRVPASTANLGPGYDVLGAALAFELELEATEAGSFDVVSEGFAAPADRSNLIVRAFESLHPADGVSFRVRSEIPLARGLGSSAAAILAGLLAADHMFELGNDREQILARATAIEGTPTTSPPRSTAGSRSARPPSRGRRSRRRSCSRLPRASRGSS